MDFKKKVYTSDSQALHTRAHMHDIHLYDTHHPVPYTTHSKYFQIKQETGNSCNWRKWIHIYYLKFLRYLEKSNNFRFLMICYAKHYTLYYILLQYYIFYIWNCFCWSPIIHSPIHLHSLSDTHPPTTVRD